MSHLLNKLLNNSPMKYPIIVEAINPAAPAMFKELLVREKGTC
jgi:hypothetical protein